MEAWKEKLASLRGKSGHAAQHPPTPPQPAGPVHLNLGVDFGTSFTKVCYRDLGREGAGDEAGIVRFSAGGLDAALLPSVLHLTADDCVLDLPSGSSRAVRYLKMRLADAASFLDDGIDVAIVRPLIARFLAKVVNRAKQSVLHLETDQLKNRSIVWSASVGVPVEYYDSPLLDKFREVFAVGWHWAELATWPATLGELRIAYDAAVRNLDPRASPCQPVPEIAAAVRSFLSSRHARYGIYVYVDVGGGTLDGVAFRYHKQLGESRISFYSGRVQPLGLEALGARVARSLAPAVEAALAQGQTALTTALPLDEAKTDIQRLVAHVIMTAKSNDPSDWRRNKLLPENMPRRSLRMLEQEDMAPLMVFIGGGAHSSWYKKVILSTHSAFQHANYGIPPYHLDAVPPPPELKLNGLQAADYLRFAVAYGLSYDVGNGPEIRLPSHLDPIVKPPRRTLAGIVDYENSKEVYQ